MSETKKTRKHKPHWYFQTWDECVLCGHTWYTRERRYDPKPKDYKDRVEFLQHACERHF